MAISSRSVLRRLRLTRTPPNTIAGNPSVVPYHGRCGARCTAATTVDVNVSCTGVVPFTTTVGGENRQAMFTGKPEHANVHVLAELMFSGTRLSSTEPDP